MNTTAVETHKTNTAPIIATLRWFDLIYQLHSFEFWRTTECTGRESGRQQMKRISSWLYQSTHFAHHVNDMREIMNLSVIFNRNIFTKTAQVIPGQIYQHDMLRIFFWIFHEFFGHSLILFFITCSSKSAGNRMNNSLSIFNQ